MRDFAEQFADWGVVPASLQSSYAMAETVFAVTQSIPGKSLSMVSRAKVKGASVSWRNERPGGMLVTEEEREALSWGRYVLQPCCTYSGYC